MSAPPTPISFVAEDVAAIRAGRLVQVRRPGVLLARRVVGDRMWLREPFHLAASFDWCSPTSAVKMGAVVSAWAADAPDGVIGLGRKRFARELPRVMHRMHLVVTAMRRENLQALTYADIVLEGARDRDQFAARWDARQHGGRTISGDKSMWADNPIVTVISFTAIAEPLG